MRQFRFANIIRKHFGPYTFVRPGTSGSYEDGKWVSAPVTREVRKGCIQPISARLRAAESGNYTATDRMLFTESVHGSGDRLEQAGTQYEVVEETEREYSDINQYVIRKVVANGPV
jgi:hypothetical protein